MAVADKLTDAELSGLAERAIQLSSDLRRVDERIRKSFGLAEDVSTPVTYAKTFSSLAMHASAAATAILIVLGNEEDRKRLEAEIRARIAARQAGEP